MVQDILKAEAPLWRAMGWRRKPCVLFIKAEDNAVSVFMNGTGSDPVIGIDMGEHIDDDGHMVHGVISSIVHELIHAYLESLGLDTYLHREKFVEKVACDYCDGMLSPKEVCAIVQKYTNWYLSRIRVKGGK